jgi:ribonuclease BN (tRNA processing enzyme)
MKLRVLGSSGAEFPDYRLPAFLIDNVMLLDAGTIASTLTAREQWKIKHVLLTHTHLDHVKGLPFLADNIIITGKSHRVCVYSTAAVLKSLKRNVLNWRVWPDFTAIPNPDDGVLKLKSIAAGRKNVIDKYTVTAHKVEHTVPAVGYVVENNKGSKLLYVGDSGPTERIWRAADSSVCCAIVEVSFPNSMEGLAIRTGHLTARLLKNEIKKMKAVPPKILISHIKPQHRSAISREIRALGVKNIHILKDGEEFDI